MNKHLVAIIFAISAALLYSINIPISKILLKNVHPVLMASLLYFGAGIGIFISSFFSRKEKKNKLTKKELPFTIAMILLDIIAPIFLMVGLQAASSSNAALLNNFEIVATSIIALVIFKEAISNKMWLAIALVSISTILLSFENIESLRFSWGSIFIILACISWGFENNCTRVLSSKSTFQIVVIKGLGSGLGSLLIAWFLNVDFPSWGIILLTLLLGFVSYGLSIYFYVKAQSVIGAAKTSAFYSFAPFLGSFLSFIILNEALSNNYLTALIIMLTGTLFIVFDTIAISHRHIHTHLDGNSNQVISHSHLHFHWQSEQVDHNHKHKADLLR